MAKPSLPLRESSTDKQLIYQESGQWTSMQAPEHHYLFKLDQRLSLFAKEWLSIAMNSLRAGIKLNSQRLETLVLLSSWLLLFSLFSTSEKIRIFWPSMIKILLLQSKWSSDKPTILISQFLEATPSQPHHQFPLVLNLPQFQLFLQQQASQGATYQVTGQ